MEFDVRYITKHWNHHSTHSGYDQLVGWLGKAIKPIDPNRLMSKLIPGRIAVYFASKSGVALYSYLSFYEELAATRDMLFKRNSRIYHVLYGDDTFRYLGRLGKGRNTRIIASYHLPPLALSEYIPSTKHLKLLDGVIVVGRNQIPFFEPILGPEKIHFVPHGVDTNVFVPGPASKRSDTSKRICLFVGVHRRDFITLRKVIELVHAQDRDVQFVIVTSLLNEELFRGMANVKIFHGVPEDELIRFYQTSDLLLQPLEDSTANNAILEGLSCGLPVVATDIGAVRDYVDENCCILVPPKDSEAMAGQVIKLLSNESLRCQMASYARIHAVQYDWSIIAKRMSQIYCNAFS